MVTLWVSMLSHFKCSIVIIITLLFTQQSFAAYAPMKCDNMDSETAVTSDKDSHLTSRLNMHKHGSISKNKISSHKKCDDCSSGDCLCGDMGSCFSSTASISAQTTEQKYMLFTNQGNRFSIQKKYPNSGVHLNLFRPPIHI
ncbi:hypothetical protein [Colwellia ponticola]|uniref:DUF2946 domain-containing protein n=1 Tax=Colwellia ponticola TaxID=2304625 RepID=A0A8H2JL74_9GAMM|nr:hypothetical protein [Colwellia ponticola]TMM42408.1 hypothetical protein FCS21_14645 [Colwellia ponticola]